LQESWGNKRQAESGQETGRKGVDCIGRKGVGLYWKPRYATYYGAREEQEKEEKKIKCIFYSLEEPG
jgi:hypothetical protein